MRRIHLVITTLTNAAGGTHIFRYNHSSASMHNTAPPGSHWFVLVAKGLFLLIIGHGERNSLLAFGYVSKAAA